MPNFPEKQVVCYKTIDGVELSADVYLPEGKWVDYFTREPVESGHFHVETEGIPGYEKVKE